MSGPNPVWELPEFTMTAGETKQLFLPIYNSHKALLNVESMVGCVAISEYINQGVCVVSIDCEVQSNSQCHGNVFAATLQPTHTVDLCGKYIYQLTVHDADGACGIMRGLVHIKPNGNRVAAIQEV